MLKTKEAAESKTYNLARQLITQERDLTTLQARLDQADSACATAAGDDAAYERAIAAAADLRGQRDRLKERVEHLRRGYRDAADAEKAALVTKLNERKRNLQDAVRQTEKQATPKRTAAEERYRGELEAIDAEISTAHAAASELDQLIKLAEQGFSDADVERLAGFRAKSCELRLSLKSRPEYIEHEELKRRAKRLTDEVEQYHENKPPYVAPDDRSRPATVFAAGPGSDKSGAFGVSGQVHALNASAEHAWQKGFKSKKNELADVTSQLQKLERALGPAAAELAEVEQQITAIMENKPSVGV